jgi:hypothetical protein
MIRQAVVIERDFGVGLRPGSVLSPPVRGERPLYADGLRVQFATTRPS